MAACQNCGKEISPKAPNCPHCGHVFKTQKKKSKAKTVLIVAAALFVMGLIGNLADSGSGAADQKPDAELQSEELLYAYTLNEVSADSKYKGKILRVTGYVSEISKDIADEAYITLATGDEFRKVQCFFGDNENQLAEISRGQMVTVQGKCDGLMMNILIDNAGIAAEGLSAVHALQFVALPVSEMATLAGHIENNVFIDETGKQYGLNFKEPHFAELFDKTAAKYCTKETKCRLTIPVEKGTAFDTVTQIFLVGKI